MTTVQCPPCELILKIGSNECDEISTAIISLLRTCSISEQSFFIVERQIQPTTYYGSFTNQSSTSSIPIQSQALSCVLLLTDDILKQQQLVRPFPLSPTNKTSSNDLDFFAMTNQPTQQSSLFASNQQQQQQSFVRPQMFQQQQQQQPMMFSSAQQQFNRPNNNSFNVS